MAIALAIANKPYSYNQWIMISTIDPSEDVYDSLYDSVVKGILDLIQN